MKIFSLEYQMLAGVIASVHGKNSYLFSNAMEGHESIFVTVPTNLWTNPGTHEAVKAIYPKRWSKWVSQKSGQFLKLGEQLKRPYNRCGTDER